MRQPEKGDLVYHLIKDGNDRVLIGFSYIAGTTRVTKTPPPQPGKWAEYSAYFRTPLEGFTSLDPKPRLRDIEAAHLGNIRDDIVPVRQTYHPYVTYGADKIRIAQGLYLAKLTSRMIEIFGMYTGIIAGESVASKPDVGEYREGERLRRERVYFARNPGLRDEAIQVYGLHCAACGFDFEAAYGALGKGFIEVHHREQLSTQARLFDAGWTASVKDVRPLCANCHRMAHRRTPPVPIDELAATIRLGCASSKV
jgi:hypothetical protein